jgi:hypothetical protein
LIRAIASASPSRHRRSRNLGVTNSTIAPSSPVARSRTDAARRTEQDEAGYDITPGSVHHTAVVTSVVDGDIRYTQHSGNQLHASLDGRGGVNALTGGTQRIHIVRPNPDW